MKMNNFKFLAHGWLIGISMLAPQRAPQIEVFKDGSS